MLEVLDKHRHPSRAYRSNACEKGTVSLPRDIVAMILLLLEKSWCVGQCQCILLFHLNDVTGSHFYL